MIACVLLFWGAFFFIGCSITSKLKPSAPNFLFKSRAGSEVTQAGNAAAPAQVTTGNTVTEIPLPPGASITINAPAVDPFNPVPEKIPVVRVTEHREQITTPTAFTPPAPPSANEIATASALRWFLIAGLILAIGAGLLLWRGHGKAALIAGIGAVAVPLLGKFLSEEWAVRALLITAGISGALFAAWHFINDKNKLPSA